MASCPVKWCISQRLFGTKRTIQYLPGINILMDSYYYLLLNGLYLVLQVLIQSD